MIGTLSLVCNRTIGSYTSLPIPRRPRSSSRMRRPLGGIRPPRGSVGRRSTSCACSCGSPSSTDGARPSCPTLVGLWWSHRGLFGDPNPHPHRTLFLSHRYLSSSSRSQAPLPSRSFRVGSGGARPPVAVPRHEPLLPSFPLRPSPPRPHLYHAPQRNPPRCWTRWSGRWRLDDHCDVAIGTRNKRHGIRHAAMDGRARAAEPDPASCSGRGGPRTARLAAGDAAGGCQERREKTAHRAHAAAHRRLAGVPQGEWEAWTKLT